MINCIITVNQCKAVALPYQAILGSIKQSSRYSFKLLQLVVDSFRLNRIFIPLSLSFSEPKEPVKFIHGCLRNSCHLPNRESTWWEDCRTTPRLNSCVSLHMFLFYHSEENHLANICSVFKLFCAFAKIRKNSAIIRTRQDLSSCHFYC